MGSKARNTARDADGGLTPRTVAHGLNGRKATAIAIVLSHGCVVHGDSLIGVLRWGATYLVIAIVILNVMKVLAAVAESGILNVRSHATADLGDAPLGLRNC